MSDFVQVRVISNARKNEVKQEAQRLKVYLTAPPVEGKANRLLLKILAEYFNCRNSDLKIVRGEKSKDKLIQRKTPRA